MLPFTFVEKEMTRKYSNLEDISYKTLMKYMHALTKKVEGKIKDEIPDRFALIFDGWTKNSTHYTTS